MREKTLTPDEKELGLRIAECIDFRGRMLKDMEREELIAHAALLRQSLDLLMGDSTVRAKFAEMTASLVERLMASEQGTRH